MDFIHQVEPYIAEPEIKAMNDYLRSGGWLTEFRKTEEFERMLADFLGVKYAVVVTSGTVALYLSMLAAEIGPSDSVMVPDYTMIASANSVKWAGADVVSCDIEKDTLCLDLNCLTLKENTRALMYVDINGRSGNMEEVVNFCKENKLYLIEDACQALGSKWNNKFLGTFGDMGVFSFTPHKIITAGQGGAVVTDNEDLYNRVKKLKDFCRITPGVDVHSDIGYNFKFTDLQAVIALEQLKTIDYRIKRKKQVYGEYMELLSDVDCAEFLPMDLEQSVPWFIDMLLKDKSRDELVLHLKKNGIGSRPFYPPIHSQKPYSYPQGNFDITVDIASRGIWLPSSISLNSEDIKRICDSIKAFFHSDE